MSDESLSRVQRLRAALTTQHLPCDIWLIVAVVALAGLGWIMVSSASVGLLENSYHYSRQHGIFLLLAIVVAILKDCNVGSKFARFLPAISKAVPWAGVVIGIGIPP